MTPERLRQLQQLVQNASFVWTYNDTCRLREPVDFQPRWGAKGRVVDFPKVKWIYFTLRKDEVYLHDTTGIALTPAYDIVWIEAEGVIIVAHALDDEGDAVAEDMVGMDCPLYRAERAKERERCTTRLLRFR